MDIQIENNIFDSNFAFQEGGAIIWNNEMPNIKNNFFTNNKANYGSNIASYPFRLAINVYNKSNYSNSSKSFNSLLFNGTNNQTFFLQNISSGNDAPYIIEVKVLDIYNNLVNLDSGY